MKRLALLVALAACRERSEPPPAVPPDARVRAIDAAPAVPGERRRFVDAHLADAYVSLHARPGGLPVGRQDRVHSLLFATPEEPDDVAPAYSYAHLPDGTRHKWPPVDHATLSAVIDALEEVWSLDRFSRHHTYYADGGTPPPPDSGPGWAMCRPPHLGIQVTVHDDSWYHVFMVDVPWRADTAAPWLAALRRIAPRLPEGTVAWLDAIAAEVARPNPLGDRPPCKG